VDPLTAFSTELESNADRPERLALTIGTLVDSALDVEAGIRRLDELADQVEQRMPAGAIGRARAEALITVLHDQMEFRGNVENYYDPVNSFLHRVLDTRLGLPITLSLLYIAIGRRLGIRLQGMGFPGHFMLEYRDPAGVWLLDPFHGKVVALDGLAKYLSRLFQDSLRTPVALEHYRVDTHALILRILNNLRAVYVSRHSLPEALTVLDFMLIVEPEEAGLWRDRALLHFGSSNLLAAENDLRRYFQLKGCLQHFAGDVEMVPGSVPFAAWLPEADSRPTGEEKRLQIVLRKIRQTVRRLN